MRKPDCGHRGARLVSEPGAVEASAQAPGSRHARRHGPDPAHPGRDLWRLTAVRQTAGMRGPRLGLPAVVVALLLSPIATELPELIGLPVWKPGRCRPAGIASPCRWRAVHSILPGDNQARHSSGPTSVKPPQALACQRVQTWDFWALLLKGEPGHVACGSSWQSWSFMAGRISRSSASCLGVGGRGWKRRYRVTPAQGPLVPEVRVRAVGARACSGR